AKVATLLAVGFTLDEIQNDITGTAASFEPTIDYVVTKIPRFTFEKFPGADSTLTTGMKSVGEAMAIGATFMESMQKALCSMETGLCGFDEIKTDIDNLKAQIRRPNADRILYVAQGMRDGLSVDDIFELSKIDRWFLNQIKKIVDFEKQIPSTLSSSTLLREAKSMGFSDAKIAQISNIKESDVAIKRKEFGITHEYREVDTCAAEFAALTPYLYSVVEKNSIPTKATFQEETRQKVLIIGGGPNRIGQGIEFDYCCVHASFALEDMGVASIMLNCNPETVSTDYDTSDILYFEPIDFEHVSAIIDREKPDGIIVHFGGQTPLKLSKKIDAMGGKIIGTPAKAIEMAEDRELFSAFANRLNLLQPENATATSADEALKKAEELTYPVLVRPSFVLGGRAMRIVHNETELKAYMNEAISVSHNSPVLIDKFLDGAIEVDVDAISDGTDVYVAGVMQHVEEAGIHSGDSACSLPPISLEASIIKVIEIQTKLIALELGVIGLLNIQFAVADGKVYLIEVNPRASRTSPFVSKATGMPLAKIATRVMWKKDLKEALKFYDKGNIVIEDNGVLKPSLKGHVCVKEAVFPFNKLYGSEIELGPEMRSTGEVMGISSSFGASFAKSQSAAGNSLPTEGSAYFSLTDQDKPHGVEVAKKLKGLGFKIMASGGTAKAFSSAGIECENILKISEGRPNIEDRIKNGEVSMLIHTSDKKSHKEDARTIRRLAVRFNSPYFTTIAAAYAAADGVAAIKDCTLSVKPIQDYLS
ncbi:MAG: carbamoylphosphate synthase, large subunit, partial [Pseudomonadota bacterium]